MGIMIDADTVLLNANVITMNTKNPRTQGVAIKGDRFLWTGDNDELKSAIGKKTVVKELGGLTILPGFIESHNHTLQFGLELSGVDLSKAKSIGDIQKLVEERVNKVERGTWILGSRYNQHEIAEKRHPNREDLDTVAPDNPVCLKHTSGHAMVVNSRGLELAGISKKTESPPGGRVIKDEKTNEPTGLLFQFSAMQFVKNVMPKPTYEDLIEGLKKANEIFLTEGITSAVDEGVGWVEAPRQISAYQEAVEKGFLNVRHTLSIWGEAVFDYANFEQELKDIDRKLLGMGIRTGLGNDRLKIGPFKFVPDGAISTATAATYESYGADPKNMSRGELMIDPEVLKKVVSAVHRLGWQLSVHGIGERAIDSGIDAIEAALRDNPRSNCRPRMEHCALLTSRMIDRIKELDIIPVLQPTFIWELGDNWISQLGKERALKAKPFRSLIDKGIRIVFGSDRPVVNGAPLLGIHSAINKKTMSGQDYALEEKLSPMEALEGYTINGAFASFDENVRGSISVGKLADLVVLSEDPVTASHDKIKDIEVLATMIGGDFVYEK